MSFTQPLEQTSRAPSPIQKGILSSEHERQQFLSESITKVAEPKPPKKLSKIQQLAEQKAALKKAASKVKVTEPSAAAAPANPSTPESSEDTRPASARASQTLDKQTQADDLKYDNVNSIIPPEHSKLRKAITPAKLSDPSSFARIVLGAMNCSKAFKKIYADRAFSCYIDSQSDKIPSASKAFSKPSPDDVVQSAQATSKGKSFK